MLFTLIKIWNKSRYCLLAGSVWAFISITIVIIFLRRKRKSIPPTSKPQGSLLFCSQRRYFKDFVPLFTIGLSTCLSLSSHLLSLFRPLLFNPWPFSINSSPLFPSSVFLLPFFHFLPLLYSLFPHPFIISLISPPAQHSMCFFPEYS